MIPTLERLYEVACAQRNHYLGYCAEYSVKLSPKEFVRHSFPDIPTEEYWKYLLEWVALDEDCRDNHQPRIPQHFFIWHKFKINNK